MTRLGNSGLEISRIGLGAWAMGGGDWAFGWGDQEDADSIQTIRRAVAQGINWIDTAAVYGLGHSEDVVGRALKEMPNGERPLVFTKCGLVWSRSGKMSHRLTPDSIRDEVNESLRRLMTDAIDLYQIHWPSYPPGSPAPELEDAWSTLAALKKAGKVRAIGVSNFSVEQMERIRGIAPIDSLQPPYSLLERQVEREILPYCERFQIGVIVYSPMKSGLLTGKMTPARIAALPTNDWRKTKSLDFLEPRLSANLNLVERMRTLGEVVGMTPAQVAIAWTLRDSRVHGAIVGARRATQIEEIGSALSQELSLESWRQIEQAIPDRENS